MRLHLARCLFALGLVLAAANSGALAQDTQLFATIDVPGGTSTIALDINDAGDIVGSYCDTMPCTNASRDAHGFLLSRGVLTTIDVPGAILTEAFGINERGDIVGVYEDAAGLHGFLLSRGR